MIISIRFVKKARTYHKCEECHKSICYGESCFDLYGMAERGDPPWHLYLCPECAAKSHDPEVKKAVEHCMHTDGGTVPVQKIDFEIRIESV